MTKHNCPGCPECPVPAHVAQALAERAAYLEACKAAGTEAW